MNGRVLVAGIGNIFLGDDAFGVEVVNGLALRDLPENVCLADYGIRSYDCLRFDGRVGISSFWSMPCRAMAMPEPSMFWSRRFPQGPAGSPSLTLTA